MAKKGSNNLLALGVGLNLDPLKTDITAAAATAKDGMDKIGNSIKGAGEKADKPLRETKDKIISLAAQMRQARQDAQMLAAGGKEMSEAFQASIAKAASLKDQIAAVDNAILSNTQTIQTNSQVTAQATKSGFNGMAMSINQLTREMPAFTYSMQTGFMAISNNIPIFIDQINAAKIANQSLAASGMPVKSIFSQVASSLFSFQTLMGVGITVLTVFGEKIYNYLTAEKELNSTLKIAIEREREYAKVIDETRYKLTQKTIALRDELSALKQGLSLDEYAIQKKERQVKNLENLVKKYNEYNDSIYAHNQEQRLRKEAIGGANDTDLQWGIIQEKNTQGLKAKIALLKDEIEQGKIQLGYSKQINQLKSADYTVTKKYVEKNIIETKIGFSDIGVLQAPKMPKTPFIQPGYIAQQAEVLSAEMLKMKIKMVNAAQELNTAVQQTLSQGMANTFTELGNVIGQMLVGAIQDPFAALGAVLLQSLGSVMTQLGTQMVTLGVGMLALDVAIKSLNPAVAIAGGVALIAAGAAIGAIASGGLKGNQSSGSFNPSGGMSSNTNPSNFNPTSTRFMENNLVISGTIRGNDLLLVNGRNDGKYNRNFRF